MDKAVETCASYVFIHPCLGREHVGSEEALNSSMLIMTFVISYMTQRDSAPRLLNHAQGLQKWDWFSIHQFNAHLFASLVLMRRKIKIRMFTLLLDRTFYSFRITLIYYPTD